MRLLRFTVLIICLLIAGACSHSHEHFQRNTYPFVYLDQCTSWSLANNDIQICLTDVQDSRCPSDVVCIWGGTVSAMLNFTEHGQSHFLTLSPKNWTTYFPSDTTVANYKIELIDISPYPAIHHHTTPDEVKAQVRITSL